MKIVETEKERFIFCKVLLWHDWREHISENRSSEKRPYRYYIYILSMPFIEFGNVQGIITYKKN
jgi:hypothetical protein